MHRETRTPSHAPTLQSEHNNTASARAANGRPKLVRSPFSCFCCCSVLISRWRAGLVRCVSALCPSPQFACKSSVRSGQLSVRLENRFLAFRASRHRPKACKTTPFPFLLGHSPSRILFCPLCSRQSNRQTFPPLSLASPAIAFVLFFLSHDTRTHLARSASSHLVTALAPSTVRCTLSNPAARLPRVKILFRSISCTLSLALRLLRGPCGLFCCHHFAPERIAKTRMALDGVAPLSWTSCRCAGAK